MGLGILYKFYSNINMKYEAIYSSGAYYIKARKIGTLVDMKFNVTVTGGPGDLAIATSLNSKYTPLSTMIGTFINQKLGALDFCYISGTGIYCHAPSYNTHVMFGGIIYSTES